MRIPKRLRAAFVYYRVYYSELRILKELEGPHGGRAWFAGHGRIVPTYKTIIAHWYSKSMIILSGLFAVGWQSVWTSGAVKNDFKANTPGEECPTFAGPKPQR